MRALRRSRVHPWARASALPFLRGRPPPEGGTFGARSSPPMRFALPLRFTLPCGVLVLFALALGACDLFGSEVARADSTVTVAYEGRLEDGRVFDESASATFSLQRVIPGFRTGVVGMRVGETRTFSVPPEQGYGNNPPDGSIIPPGATLIFEVTLLDVR